MDELITARVLAEKLGVHYGTVRIWTCKGRIPVLRIGRARRYVMQDVLAALDKNEIRRLQRNAQKC